MERAGGSPLRQTAACASTTRTQAAGIGSQNRGSLTEPYSTSAGYGVGLLLTYLALEFEVFGSSGQPALLYLVPCTLGTITVKALLRGDLRALMAGEHGDLRRRREDCEEGGDEGRGRLQGEGGASSERAALLDADGARGS